MRMSSDVTEEKFKSAVEYIKSIYLEQSEMMAMVNNCSCEQLEGVESGLKIAMEMLSKSSSVEDFSIFTTAFLALVNDKLYP